MRALQVRRCNGRELSRAVHGTAETVEQCARAAGGMQWSGGGPLLAAHGRGTMEEAGGGGNRHERRDLRTATGLAEQRHALRIAAESPDVLAYPAQREHQVQRAGVA